MPKDDIPRKHELFAKIIESIGVRDYLEIGVSNGKNLEGIHVPNRVGVDPVKLTEVPGVDIFTMTSDDYFESTDSPNFDLIFVDGLHQAEQVWRDIGNSLERLNEGGAIVLHDCLPWSEYVQRYPRPPKPRKTADWVGTAWKAWVALHRALPGSVTIIDLDVGFGFIRPGIGLESLKHVLADESHIQEAVSLTWEDFLDIRKEMGSGVIVSSDEFYSSL